MSHALPGAIPSPNIWHTPRVYELENQAVDPDGRIEAAMRRMIMELDHPSARGWAGEQPAGADA